ncbi:hypothetical protein [Streptomyces sp. NPDC095613]|uniref:hypothetical protein n=1 Tax=Streptomyces sp. NPDC095613 TaxID=3155540 RepID=UPI00331EA0BA
MCAQCGTRYDDWDHGGDGEEDAYAASVQLCTGCEVIADKQDELSKSGESINGRKIALIPVSVHAALQTERDLKNQLRRRRDADGD